MTRNLKSFDRTLDRYDVLPLHPGWAHRQSTSGVFSMAELSVLQYLPDVVMHEQIGCAHFFASTGVIFVPPKCELLSVIPAT